MNTLSGMFTNFEININKGQKEPLKAIDAWKVNRCWGWGEGITNSLEKKVYEKERLLCTFVVNIL